MADVPSNVMLGNGMVVGRGTLSRVYGELLVLQELNPFSFWQMVSICRDPKFHLMKETKEILIKRELLHRDGCPKADVQNIVLYLVSGNRSTVEIITFAELKKNFVVITEGKDIE